MGKELIRYFSTFFWLMAVSTFLLAVMISGVGFLKLYPEWRPIELSGQKEDGNQKELIAAVQIKDGIHEPTGLIADDGLTLVINNCTHCHAANLITQNRGDEQQWRDLIRWMQRTQGLWDLGEQEEAIVAYLAKNYAPESRGRRVPLEIEWYELEGQDKKQ